jgi:hypothetical protein
MQNDLAHRTPLEGNYFLIADFVYPDPSFEAAKAVGKFLAYRRVAGGKTSVPKGNSDFAVNSRDFHRLRDVAMGLQPCQDGVGFRMPHETRIHGFRLFRFDFDGGNI